MQHTNQIILILFLLTILVLPSANAVIVEALSEVDYQHTYVVNNGAVPTGISIGNVPGSLDIKSSRQTNVDLATAINETAGFVQVGNPFSEPPLPFLSQREERTTFNDGMEGARTSFNVSVTAIDGPDADPSLTSIIERDIENDGAAELVLSTEDVAAQASSSFSMTRSYLIENTSNFRQSFSIEGFVEFDFLSEFSGVDGFANAAMSVYSLFENVAGVNASFELTSEYAPDVSLSGLGASMFDLLSFNEPLVGGFLFSGSTTANGSGDLSSASISEFFSYRLDLIMEAGTSLEFITGFTQRNTVEYGGQTIDINTPSTIGLLSLALLMFARLYLKKRLEAGYLRNR